MARYRFVSQHLIPELTAIVMAYVEDVVPTGRFSPSPPPINKNLPQLPDRFYQELTLTAFGEYIYTHTTPFSSWRDYCKYCLRMFRRPNPIINVPHPLPGYPARLIRSEQDRFGPSDVVIPNANLCDIIIGTRDGMETVYMVGSPHILPIVISTPFSRDVVLFLTVSPRFLDYIPQFGADKWKILFDPTAIGLMLTASDLKHFNNDIFIVFEYVNIRYSLIFIYNPSHWHTDEPTFDGILTRANMSVDHFITTLWAENLHELFWVKINGVNVPTTPLREYIHAEFQVHRDLIMELEMRSFFPYPLWK